MLIGAVADDITGATDLALMLSRSGLQTIQVMGVPDVGTRLDQADAVVVALKSRTIPAADAIAMSRQAARALLDAGAEQLIFKYCSTFDSTDKGNIGPVAEALLDLTGADLTIACPSFPAAGRTVYKGHLFVGDRLLSESPLKDHPLTPMRDPDLVRVLSRQTKLPVGLVESATIRKGAEAVRAAFDAARAQGERILVVDTLTDDDLKVLGEACRDMKFITGGSGIGLGLAESLLKAGRFTPQSGRRSMPATEGRAAILAGSCSVATRGQIAAAKAAGLTVFPLDVSALADGTTTAEAVADQMTASSPDSVPLVYSSADPETLTRIQEKYGRDRSGSLVEDTLAEIARRLVATGFTRLIVAGGETSGAVVAALGVQAISIGPEIDPGVPWTRSIAGPDLALALKSGNFGAENFFLKAWSQLDPPTAAG